MIGAIRRIDRLGRITLPADMRGKLELYDGTRCCIALEEDKIIITKVMDTDLKEDLNSILSRHSVSDQKAAMMIREFIEDLKAEGVIQ